MNEYKRSEDLADKYFHDFENIAQQKEQMRMSYVKFSIHTIYRIVNNPNPYHQNFSMLKRKIEELISVDNKIYR